MHIILIFFYFFFTITGWKTRITPAYRNCLAFQWFMDLLRCNCLNFYWVSTRSGRTTGHPRLVASIMGQGSTRDAICWIQPASERKHAAAKENSRKQFHLIQATIRKPWVWAKRSVKLTVRLFAVNGNVFHAEHRGKIYLALASAFTTATLASVPRAVTTGLPSEAEVCKEIQAWGLQWPFPGSSYWWKGKDAQRISSFVLEGLVFQESPLVGKRSSIDCCPHL